MQRRLRWTACCNVRPAHLGSAMNVLAETWLPVLALAGQLPFFLLRLRGGSARAERAAFLAALAGAGLGLVLGLRDADVTLLLGQLAALCLILRLRRAGTGTA